MSSYIYYKFKSQRTEQRIAFDGTGISVFDLKKEIILSNNFGKASDVDLLLFDSSDKEYSDDSQIIPRSTSVIAKRMPASKPGKGKAAIYISAATGPSSSQSVKQDPKLGTSNSAPSVWNKSTGGAISKRFDGKDDKTRAPSGSKHANGADALNAISASKVDTKVESHVADDEAERIKAMFQANDEHWKETQERMSHATPIYTNRGGAPKRPFQPSPHPKSFESKPLPPGYICHRCSKPGHWIQDCPTNDDRDFDNRPRIKRTTGIPRSFLKPVEAPEGAQGVMVTPEGGFVVAQPDVASWEKQRSRPTPLTAADVREKAPSDPTLACPICSKLLRDAVKTPCCSKTFDEECIHTHLLENDFICPSCHKTVASLDKVTVDLTSRERVRKYIEAEIAKSVAPVDSEQKTLDTSPKLPGQTEAGPSVLDSNDDPEITFDSQPGINVQDSGVPTGIYDLGGSNLLSTELTSIESQIQHVMMMLSNPQLTPQLRMQFQMQLPQLTVQLNTLRQMSLYGDPYMNAGAMSIAMGGQSGQGGYNSISPDIMGYGGQGYSSGHVFNNPGLLNDADSPYQRVAPNNRRRVQKRDRPEDFVDVNNGGQKYPRFYE